MNLHAASDCLGVHYQTAYRWVRTGRLAAVKRGTAYEITEAEVARCLEARRAPIPPPRTVRVRAWNAQVSRLYEALVGGDERRARLMTDRLHGAGVEAMPLIDQLFAPALRRLGEDWATERISVATEHRASAICERLLARVTFQPRGRPRGVAVVATPPGDEHGLPATMAAVALRAARWRVHHLGTQVPLADLVELARSVRANLVVISVTNPLAKAEAERARDLVRHAGLCAIVGGPGRSVRQLIRDTTPPWVSGVGQRAPVPTVALPDRLGGRRSLPGTEDRLS